MLNTQKTLQPQICRQQINHTPSQKKNLDAGIVVSATHLSNSVSVPIVIIRLPQVLQKIGIGRSKLYLLLDSRSKYFDSEFPKPISLGLRSIGWNLAEVENWLQKKLDERPDSISPQGMTLGEH